MLRASSVMRMAVDLDAETIARCDAMLALDLYVKGGDTLETAMPMFDREQMAFVPVISGLSEGDQPN